MVLTNAGILFQAYDASSENVIFGLKIMTSIAAKCKSYDATPAFDLSAATTVPQLILFARIIRRHRVMYPCVVCLSVCMSVTLVHPAKFVGQNQMPFSMDIV